MLEPALRGVGQALGISVVSPSVWCGRGTLLRAARLVQIGSGALERQGGWDWDPGLILNVLHRTNLFLIKIKDQLLIPTFLEIRKFFVLLLVYRVERFIFIYEKLNLI